MRKKSAGFSALLATFGPYLRSFGPSRRTTRCTWLQTPALQLPHPLEQVDSQCRPRQLRLRLAHSEVPRSGQVDSFLHGPEALLDLVAQRCNGLVHLRLQGMYRVTSTGLELNQIADAHVLEVLPVGRANATLVGQHTLGLSALLDQLVNDAGQYVHFGFVGGMDFDVLNTANFRVQRAVAAIADEGVLPFLTQRAS